MLSDYPSFNFRYFENYSGFEEYMQRLSLSIWIHPSKFSLVILQTYLFHVFFEVPVFLHLLRIHKSTEVANSNSFAPFRAFFYESLDICSSSVLSSNIHTVSFNLSLSRIQFKVSVSIEQVAFFTYKYIYVYIDS